MRPVRTRTSRTRSTVSPSRRRAAASSIGLAAVPATISADAAGENSGPRSRRSASWAGPSMLSSASGPIARSISSPWVPGPTVRNRAGSVRMRAAEHRVVDERAEPPERDHRRRARGAQARERQRRHGEPQPRLEPAGAPGARREARSRARRQGAGGQRTSTGSPRLSWWRYQAITPRSPYTAVAAAARRDDRPWSPMIRSVIRRVRFMSTRSSWTSSIAERGKPPDCR